MGRFDIVTKLAEVARQAQEVNQKAALGLAGDINTLEWASGQIATLATLMVDIVNEIEESDRLLAEQIGRHAKRSAHV